jgi:hypothetical protein
MTRVSPYSNSAIAPEKLSDIVGEINGFRPLGSYSSLDLLEEHARAERPHVLLLQLTPAVHARRSAPNSSAFACVNRLRSKNMEFAIATVSRGGKRNLTRGNE